jgi:hypothetical protein
MIEQAVLAEYEKVVAEARAREPTRIKQLSSLVHHRLAV